MTQVLAAAVLVDEFWTSICSFLNCSSRDLHVGLTHPQLHHWGLSLQQAPPALNQAPTDSTEGRTPIERGSLDHRF